MSGVAKIASEKAAGVADRVETQKIRGTLVEGFNTLKDTTQQTMQGGTETEVYVPPDPEPIVMKLRTMQAGYDISWNPETVGYTFSNALALLNGCILTTFSSEDSKRWGPILAQAPPKNILSFEVLSRVIAPVILVLTTRAKRLLVLSISTWRSVSSRSVTRKRARSKCVALARRKRS